MYDTLNDECQAEKLFATARLTDVLATYANQSENTASINSPQLLLADQMSWAVGYTDTYFISSAKCSLVLYFGKHWRALHDNSYPENGSRYSIEYKEKR